MNELAKYGDWGAWSLCKSCDDTQVRTRQCQGLKCFGLARQVRKCACLPKVAGFDASLNDLLIGKIPQTFNLIHLMVACGLTFLLGSFVVLCKLDVLLDT